MAVWLREIFARFLDEDRWLIVPHSGKSDLERSIPRKLRQRRTPGDRFLILRDNHGADCAMSKEKLRSLCEAAGRSDTIVRIVCQELESWHLGDLHAVGEAFGISGLSELATKAIYRDPDRLVNAQEELKKLVPPYQKVSGSRAIGRFLDPDRNRSHSFRIFWTSITSVM